MSGLFSRRTLRNDPFLRYGLLTSFLITTLLMIFVHTPSGEYFGGFSDHLHHPRATYNFFAMGLEVYRMEHGSACQRVDYGYGFGYWPMYPVAYPPGMFVVFAGPALLGRYPLLSVPAFGKVVIAYLTVITHAAMWGFTVVSRRVRSVFWMLVIAFVWTLMLRTSLTGFYDGAWLLTGVLGVWAMMKKRPAAATLWFVASALVSYRAASLAPIAAAALWQLVRSEESVRTKTLVTLASAIGGAIVVACFWALMHFGPHDQDSAHSGFVPFWWYSWFLFGLGLVTGVVLCFGTSLLVGACVMFSTLLVIYHAGHAWHGTVCTAPLLALALSRKQPIWAQVVLALWLAFNLQYAFGFTPFTFLDDMLHVIERGGGTYRG